MNQFELDAVASRYEREWGVGRLPLLVGAEMAAKWQAALDMLAAEYPPAGRTWEQLRASLAKGWGAMAEEATLRGHEPLPGPVAEAEWEPGRVFAIALDAAHAQALNLRAKADGRKPDAYCVWTVLDVARLVQSIPLASDILATWPGAEVLPPRLPPVGRVPRDDLGPVLEPETQEASA